MTVYLNIRNDLTRETKDTIKKLAREQGITMGELLNRTFSK